MSENNDIVTRLRWTLTADTPARYPEIVKAAANEIERLRVGQAVVTKQVGFYKPETPDFEFVRVPLGILRRALHCVPPPYPEDGSSKNED